MLSLACMQKVDRRAPLPGLTALRFFAASYVLLFHMFPVSGSDALHATLVQRLVGAGFTGVSCFFVLSGFILAYTHPSVPNRAKFFRARFARIYPLYLFAFLLALPNFLKHAVLSGPGSELWAVPADVLLVQGWFPSLALFINTPAWTLSCEAFFYLLFPFVVQKAWLRPRRPFFFITALWVIQALPAILTDYWLLPRYPGSASVLRAILFTPLCRVGEFLAGVALGLAFLRWQEATSQEGFRPNHWLLPASVAFCLTILCLNYTLPHEVVRNGLMVGPFGLLIWALARSKSRWLASRPLQLGGEISYGVYLLQVPLSHWLYTILSRTPLALFPSRVWILLVYPFAWFTYLIVEKPCRDWILGRKPSRASKPIPTPQPELP